MMEQVCTGIDVDKKSFKVCLISKKEKKRILGSRTFTNGLAGFDDFKAWVKKKAGDVPINYVMEATGVYHEQLAHYLHQQSKALVHIVLPLKAKYYLRSLGVRSKTDQIDAKGLAMMGLEQDLECWMPASKNLLELRSLTRQLEILQEHRTALKNQLEAAEHSMVMHKSVIKSLKELIKQTEKQSNLMEGHLEKVIFKDPVLASKYELINPIKGVGLITFAVLAAETNGFTLFKNQRQLVSYCGYDIVRNQSGQKEGKTSISKKGNTHIRRILGIAAWSVVRYEVAPFQKLYQRVFERNGIKMKAYVAVQRKLLVTIYTLWKKDEKFNPEFRKPGNDETKLLFSESTEETPKETASKNEAALDGHPNDQSPEALFFVHQN